MKNILEFRPPSFLLFCLKAVLVDCRLDHLKSSIISRAFMNRWIVSRKDYIQTMDHQRRWHIHVVGKYCRAAAGQLATHGRLGPVGILASDGIGPGRGLPHCSYMVMQGAYAPHFVKHLGITLLPKIEVPNDYGGVFAKVDWRWS